MSTSSFTRRDDELSKVILHPHQMRAADPDKRRNIRKLAEIVPNIRVTYRQGELTDLCRALDAGPPPTAFVWTGELPYWSVETWRAAVLVGYDARCFYVNDPAFDAAPQLVAQGDFNLAWLAYDSYYAVVEPA